MSFRKYQHIERYGTDEVADITTGKCFIFPKVDGTNSSIWFENGKLHAGSRNRELSLDKDNAGFFEWVLNNKQRFLSFFTKYPNCRLFGEWLVPHTIKTYRDVAWRNLYIFDVVIDKENGLQYLPYDLYAPMLKEFGIEFIAPQKIIINPTIEDLQRELDNNHYLMDKEDNIGEGIVIKNYGYYNKYGRRTWAKIVRQEFKEKHRKTMGIPAIDNVLVESKIVEKYVTKAFVEKEKSKIENEVGGWNSKLIPRLLSQVFYSLVTEETWHFVKENKFPKIDFKTLNNLTTYTIKVLCPEIFP